MSAIWLERLRRAEYLLLCGLALVLPIFETPKNLIIFLLLFVWVAQRVVSRDLAPGRPDIIGISLLFMLVSCLASTLANWPLANGLKGLRHTMMQVLVFWMIYRTVHSERQQLRLVEMIVAGVVIGLLWGIVEYVHGNHEYLVFHSVGGVIESAVYLGVALATVFSVVWASPNTMSAVRLVRSAAPGWTAVAIMLVGLFFMGNRAAILAVLVVGILYALVIGRRAFWLAVFGSMLLVAVFTTMLPDWFNQSRWLAKMQEMTATGQLTLATPDVQRLDHWRVGTALVMKGDTLWLGIGPHNSISIDYSKMKFDPPLGPLPEQLLHLHNMFLTKLVEEGIVGLAAMLFFFGVVIVRLVQDYRRGNWNNWPWMAAAGALTVALVAGQVGPRWHQEQVLLVMMILAMYFNSRRTAAGETR